MSYGNCCVVSDIPENREVVGDKAVCFRKSDADDLRHKLEVLLASPEKVREYKEASAAYICGKYNWDDIVDQTIRVYGCEEGKGNYV